MKSIHEKKPKNKSSCCSMPLLPVVKSWQQHQRLCEERYGQAYAKNVYVVKHSDGSKPGFDYLKGRLKDTLVLLHESTIVTLHQPRRSTATFLRSQGFSLSESDYGCGIATSNLHSVMRRNMSHNE